MREELKPLRLAVAASFAGGEVPDEALLARIDEELTAYRRLSIEEKTVCRKELFDSFRGMDILQKALDDDEVTEIMVNGLEGIWLEKGSEIVRWDRSFDDRETLEEVIQLMAASVNRLVNTTTPIADLRLPDGSRVNIVLPPAAPDGPVMTIRKFYRSPLTMEKLIGFGSVTPEAAAFLRSAVRIGCNIFISGGTGSGKTTFLNALSEFIPAQDRVITIEDSLELKLQGLPNLVRLETRNENLEGAGRISIRDLIRTALRMRSRSAGHAAGDERRQRRLPVHRPCEQCGRHAEPSGNDGAHGRRAASRSGAGPDRFGDRPDRTSGPYGGRKAPRAGGRGGEEA